MSSINVGDQIRVAFTLVDYTAAAWQPAGSGRIVFRVWEVGLTRKDDPTYEKTWLAAGGGDAEVVRDGAGLFHFLYVTTPDNQGKNLGQIQSYVGIVSDDNSREKTDFSFIAE